MKDQKSKKNKEKNIEKVKIYVLATFNNTIVTLTDMDGNVLYSTSCGAVGFKGARKATPYAATVTVEKAVSKVLEYKVKSVDILIKGPGPGRDAVLRVVRAANLKIDLIADITPIPHDGCRPKKKRRV